MEDTYVEGGTKYDVGKPRWDLVPMGELEEVVKVMTFGAAKYADNGWKAVDKERYIAALMRHVVAYQCGEKFDRDSGLAHMAHIQCNALFIQWKDSNEINIKDVTQGCKGTGI